VQLSEKMEVEFNRQLTMELEASHAYLAMAGWFDRAGFPGFATWMRLQSDEERLHALKIYQFILDRDGSIRIGSLDAPKFVYESVVDVFESALRQEQEVTASITRMYGLANDESDVASLPILQWFVNEQIEEESTVKQIIDDVRFASGNPQALLLLDRELGARTAPTPV